MCFPPWYLVSTGCKGYFNNNRSFIIENADILTLSYQTKNARNYVMYAGNAVFLLHFMLK